MGDPNMPNCKNDGREVRAAWPVGPWLADASPVVIIGLRGWSDVGKAASTAMDVLLTAASARKLFDIDLDAWTDFAATRASLRIDDSGKRSIVWQSMSVHAGSLQGRTCVFIEGDEPGLRWRAFTSHLLAELEQLTPEMVVFLGGTYALDPHTRSVRVTGRTNSPALAARRKFTPSDYQGPTGILGVLAVLCEERDIPIANLWANVPDWPYRPIERHSPGAVALIRAIESVTGVVVETATLEAAARQWLEEQDAYFKEHEDFHAGDIEDLEAAYDKREADNTGP